ncbi:hypothetical protein Mx9_p80 [Myxococcus phage Mx9]|nr:hypothetical protein Mx9_p80 [Myxococcus phage Mx9]
MSGEESLRGSLEAAMEKHSTPAETSAPVESAAPAEPAETPAVEASETPAQAEPSAQPQVGAKPAPPAQAKPGQPVAGAPAASAAPGTETPAAPKQPDTRAPQSWRPGVREQWAKLPPEVQQEVVRREGEVQKLLQESSEHRKVAQAFQQTVQPYMGMIQAEGGEPVRAIAGLLQTAAALRTAPPLHKAQLVAQIIQGYRVPLDALDAALAGQQPPAGAQQPQQHFDPNELLQQAEQRVMQRFQAQAQQARTSKVQQELEAFVSSGKAEFLDDVRPYMSSLLAAASQSGVAMSLEDAYNQAVRMHPELRGVLQQREQAAQATASQAATQRARAAASSVKSTPVTSAAPKDESLRGTIEAAWANSSGR